MKFGVKLQLLNSSCFRSQIKVIMYFSNLMLFNFSFFFFKGTVIVVLYIGRNNKYFFIFLFASISCALVAVAHDAESKISRSILGSSSLHVEMSLGKVLLPVCVCVSANVH